MWGWRCTSVEVAAPAGQRGTRRGLHPNGPGNAPREQNCMVCRLSRAGRQGGVTADSHIRLTGCAYNELEIFRKGEPEGGKHTLKQILRVVDAVLQDPISF